MAPVRYSSVLLPASRYIPGRGTHPRDMATPHVPEIIENDNEFGLDNWTHSCRYRYAIDLFNNGYWWETHEVLEELWLQTGRTTPVALGIQGIIQFCASLLKHSLEEITAAETLFVKGSRKLPETESFLGIDLLQLKRQMQLYIDGESSSAPKIHLDLVSSE